MSLSWVCPSRFNLNSEASTRGKTAAGSGLGAVRRGVPPAIDFPSHSSSVPIPEPTDSLSDSGKSKPKGPRKRLATKPSVKKTKASAAASSGKKKPAAAGNGSNRNNTVVDKRFSNGPPVGLLGNSGRGNVYLSVGGPKKTTMLNM